MNMLCMKANKEQKDGKVRVLNCSTESATLDPSNLVCRNQATVRWQTSLLTIKKSFHTILSRGLWAYLSTSIWHWCDFGFGNLTQGKCTGIVSVIWKMFPATFANIYYVLESVVSALHENLNSYGNSQKVMLVSQFWDGETDTYQDSLPRGYTDGVGMCTQALEFPWSANPLCCFPHCTAKGSWSL